MYNSYGERRVRYASVPLAAILDSVRAAGLVPADAALIGVTLQEPNDGAINGYAVRLVCEHADWPVCLAGEQMSEALPATATTEPESSDPVPTATTEPESSDPVPTTEAEPTTEPATTPAEE